MGMLGQPSAAFLTHFLFLTFAFDFGTLASCLFLTRVSTMLVLGGDPAVNGRKERKGSCGVWVLWWGNTPARNHILLPRLEVAASTGQRTQQISGGRFLNLHIPFSFLDLGREKWRSTAPLEPHQWGWDKGVLVKASCHHRLGALIASCEMTLLP